MVTSKYSVDPLEAPNKMTKKEEDLYSQFQAAMAMAKSEGAKLTNEIRAEITRLRTQADELEAFLATNPTYEIDSWYDTIIKERKITK